MKSTLPYDLHQQKLAYIPNAKFLTNPIVFMAFKVQTPAGVTRINRLNKYEIGHPNNHYK